MPIEPAATTQAASAPEESLTYAQAQQLLAVYRTQGEAALTPAQHQAIWDCLLEQPESTQWLQAQAAVLHTPSADSA